MFVRFWNIFRNRSWHKNSYTIGIKKFLFVFVFLRIYNLKQEDDPRVTSLGKRSVIFWVTAVICWINDKLYCEVWSNIGFPYLHGFWHVLIFLASYTAVVLFAYFDVKHNHPHEVPMIQYWPKDTFELGIPYVKLKNYHWNKKEHNIWRKKWEEKWIWIWNNPIFLVILY